MQLTSIDNRLSFQSIRIDTVKSIVDTTNTSGQIEDMSSVSEVPTQQRAHRRRWWHVDPPDPQRYSCGRMMGTLKELANAIDVNPKTLRKMNQDGVVWIRNIHGKLWEIWFTSTIQYTEAFKRFERI